MEDTLYRSPADVQTLAPYPTPNENNLPYNYSNTPFFGDPTQVPSDVNQASVTVGNVTYQWSSRVQDMLTSLDAVGLQAWLVGQLPPGTDLGGWAAARWQEFFYFFEPFIDNTVYEAQETATDDTDPVYNKDYYDHFFDRAMVAWIGYKQQNSTDQLPLSTSSWIGFLEEADLNAGKSPLVDNLRTRQRNVILWQFLRVLSMFQPLTDRAVMSSSRQIVWLSGEQLALQNMAQVMIRPYRPSSENYQIPDPSSVADQGNDMLTVERYRGNYKSLEQQAQMEDSVLSYASDALSQQQTSLTAFWDSLSTIMQSILNK